APLTWTPAHEKAFHDLQNILSSPKSLYIINPNQPISLHSNWSTHAIGGWIGQEHHGTLQPIAFESQKLRSAEKNYSPYNGELLALGHCLKIFRPYLLNRPVLLKSDQKTLKWLLTQ